MFQDDAQSLSFLAVSVILRATPKALALMECLLIF
jgi:hypothetical protein